ncbi:MAG TPA: DUF3365 domain-containing protein [Steroidobacteraceae bacterium]|nr:DUF3365 domain-containing protein [Steroidobacteraceae bacterium]
MSLLVRMNIVLVVGFALAGTAVAYICQSLLQTNARREVLGTASLMLDSALASRAYTANEIDPLLAAEMHDRFVPQSIPFYAATQNFLVLRKRHPDFYYKEATLNPTNPRDRATDWEADIIQQFRNHAGLGQIEGERDGAMGHALYLARPIRAEPECLICHGLASAAPAALLARYGRDNGFGWQANEVVGAQIVSAPFNEASARAASVLRGIVITTASALTALLLLVNLALFAIVVRPLRRMARHADEVSLGRLTSITFEPAAKSGEIAGLAQAFERLRKSVEKALKMVGG